MQHLKKKKIKNVLIFIFLYFFIDLTLTQFFLINFYYKKLESQHIGDSENRISNRDYKYTFTKKKSFKSIYLGHVFTVKTNNLGFRDSKVRDLDKTNHYTIVIGDSFVEGNPLEFEDSLVGYLNKKLRDEKINKFEFLNAGVSSYSSYIYQKKIISILDNNPWIKTKMVIVLLDKSDVSDDLSYLDKPEFFLHKEKHQFVYKGKFFDDLRKLYFWNYEIFVTKTYLQDLWRFIYRQTITGIFLKKTSDIIELEARNLRDRYKLSKKLEKSFFKISSKQIKAFRSINTRTYLTKYFYGDLWMLEGKKSVDFSIENLMLLKNYLNSKDIKMLVVLYPWAFELADKIPRENYLNYILPKLDKKKINYILAYEHFLSLKNDVYTNITDNYVYNDIHFNKQGYKILSDIIWKEISNSIIKKSK